MNETNLHLQLLEQNKPSASFLMHHGGVMPQAIVVAMAETQAIDGAYDFNPWHFHHFYTSYMGLSMNGREVPDMGGLEFDFTQRNGNAQFARAYHWLFENTGALEADRGNLIHWNAFQAGQFIIPFDLSPDKCNGLHNHEPATGPITFNIRFSQPLTRSIYVIYKLIFPKQVTNKKAERKVFVDDIKLGPG